MPSVIKVIVAGKKIEDVLLALEPFALEPPVVQVITEKATSPARKRLSHANYGAVVAHYVDHQANKGEKSVAVGELKQICIENGGQHNSYSYGLKKLLQEKRLKKTPNPRIYEIVK